jgi:hypothetical protein
MIAKILGKTTPFIACLAFGAAVSLHLTHQSYEWTVYLDESTVKGAKTANLLCNSELKACTYMDSKAHMQAADTVINRRQASPIPVTEFNKPDTGRAPITVKKSLSAPEMVLQSGLEAIQSAL